MFLWRIGSGQDPCVPPVAVPDLSTGAISVEGRFALLHTRTETELWDLDRAERLRTLPGARVVSAVTAMALGRKPWIRGQGWVRSRKSAMRGAMSGRWVSRAKWPVGNRWSSASGRSRR